MSNIKREIEALIFVSEVPISSNEISSFLDISKDDCNKILNELVSDWLHMNLSIEIHKVSGGYQFRTKEEYKDKFEFIEDNHSDADFIFTNYYYFKNPKFNKKRYNIPKNFSSYYQFKIGEKTVNELYINNLKHN